MSPVGITSNIEHLVKFNPVISRCISRVKPENENTLYKDVFVHLNNAVGKKTAKYPSDFFFNLAYIESAVTSIQVKTKRHLTLSCNPPSEIKGKKLSVVPDIFVGDLDKLSFKQGKLGTCYILSSLYSLAHNSVASKILKDCVRENIDGSYIVRFKGLNKSVKVSADELDDSMQTHGEKGLQVMEVAYGKIRKTLDSKYSDKSTFNAAAKGLPDVFMQDLTGLKPFKISSNNKIGSYALGYTFSGKIRELKEEMLIAKMCKDEHCEKILQKQIDDGRKRCKKIKLLLDDISDNPKQYAMAALSKLSKGSVSNDSKIYTIGEHMFYQDHVYAIKSSNKTARTVTLINPHDTSKDIEIPYSIFLRAFSEISGLKLPP